MNKGHKIPGEFLKIEKDSHGFKIHWVDASGKTSWNIMPDDLISEDAHWAESEILELQAKSSKTSDPKRVEDIKQKIKHFEMQALWPEMYKAYCRGESLDTFFEKEASLQEVEGKRDDSKDRVIEVQNKMILKYRNDKKYPKCPGTQVLFDIADKCRLKNGKINISKLAKKLGKSDKTARDWCKWRGVK